MNDDAEKIPVASDYKELAKQMYDLSPTPEEATKNLSPELGKELERLSNDLQAAREEMEKKIEKVRSDFSNTIKPLQERCDKLERILGCLGNYASKPPLPQEEWRRMLAWLDDVKRE
jgi:predicted  nucleic acid-binding Zn-ribbon protein